MKNTRLLMIRRAILVILLFLCILIIGNSYFLFFQLKVKHNQQKSKDNINESLQKYAVSDSLKISSFNANKKQLWKNVARSTAISLHGRSDELLDPFDERKDRLANEIFRSSLLDVDVKTLNIFKGIWNARKTSDNGSITFHDRLLRQLRYTPINKNSTDKLKIIYVPAGLDSATPYGSAIFQREKCKIANCYLTKKHEHEMTADMRLLQTEDAFTVNPPWTQPGRHKPKHQIWIVWLLESPANTVNFLKLKDLVNWTVTYRWDSTIVTPYSKFVPYNNLNIVPKQPRRNYAAGKTKFIAWFVSNCYARNLRREFVDELSKFVPVDIYGHCGTLECSKDKQKDCFKMLNQDYKFYLSFENSNCDYYITEKFFDLGLKNDIIPIVMGARKEDYNRVAPPHSFIHVEDFPDAASLAKYLIHLNASQPLYEEYFAWKNTGYFVDTKFWCRLCAMLNAPQAPRMWYRDFNYWWRHPGACRKDRWD